MWSPGLGAGDGHCSPLGAVLMSQVLTFLELFSLLAASTLTCAGSRAEVGPGHKAWWFGQAAVGRGIFVAGDV